ncbi:hypothetical protein AEP_03713 [Curvibacter sp. AEP1-3]|nr:hypothetical protein AEP_03713 [Curvibacter sp. AEP1-3]
MTLLDILQGLGSVLVFSVGVTVLYMFAKGCWLLLVRSLQATARFARDGIRNPRQAVVDAPFLIQLLILPFLLAWERVDKWRHPEEARRRQALFKRNQAAAQVFQSRLDQVALYREGRTITLCKIVRFEVSEHFVNFNAEPVPHAGFTPITEPWSFGTNWNDFFYDAKVLALDSQFMRWRVNFDDERISKLGLYAATLPPELDPIDRSDRLEHFWTYGMDADARAHKRLAVEQAQFGLKAYIQNAQAAGDGGAWLKELPEALEAVVNIMSAHAFPGGPDDLSEIRFEERCGDVVMWVPIMPNPWRIQFSEDNLLRWWKEQNA